MAQQRRGGFKRRKKLITSQLTKLNMLITKILSFLAVSYQNVVKFFHVVLLEHQLKTNVK